MNALHPALLINLVNLTSPGLFEEPEQILSRIFQTSEVRCPGWMLERKAILESTLVMRWSNSQGWVHGAVYLCSDMQSALRIQKERELMLDSINMEAQRYSKKMRDTPVKESLYWTGPFDAPKSVSLFRVGTTVVQVDAPNMELLCQFSNMLHESVSSKSSVRPEATK